MKKSIFLSIAAAVLVFAGCAKEETSPLAKKGTFSIFASAPDTKMENDGLTSSWSFNDAINLYHESSDALGTYVSDGEFKTQYADGVFTGELAEELVEGTTYNWYAFYPYNSNVRTPGERTSGYLTVGQSKTSYQLQTGNNSTSHLASTYYPLYGKATAAAGTTPELVMHRLTSVVALNITNGTSDPLTVSEITFTVAGQDIVGTYYIDITGDTPVYTGSGDNYVGGTARLNVKDGEAIAPKESAKFYFAIKPVRVTSDNPVSVTVTDADGQSFIKDNITVNAEFKAGSIKTLNLTIDGFSNDKGTSAANPYTVAEALALFDGTVPTNVVFVKGIISKIDEISTQFGNATYYISDDGTTADQLELYRGKYLDGASFTSTDQIGVGDEVIVKGTLTLYNTTKEMAAGNEIVELNRAPFLKVNPETLSVAAAGGSTAFTISCLDDQEWEVFPQQSWVTCEPESGTGPATITVTVAANTGDEARDCDIDVEVGSGLDTTVSLTQDGASSSETEAVDVLNQTWTGVTGTSYTEKIGLKGSASSAMYTVQCAGGNGSIQLRSNNSNSGIVSTTSGGKVKKVVVEWEGNTLEGRTLNIYGSNTAYTSPTNLYDESKQGTLLGTIVNGTSTKLEVSGDYSFVGIRSANYAMYLTKIEITWEK